MQDVDLVANRAVKTMVPPNLLSSNSVDKRNSANILCNEDFRNG